PASPWPSTTGPTPACSGTGTATPNGSARPTFRSSRSCVRSSGSYPPRRNPAGRCRASPTSHQLFFLGGEGAAEVRRRHPVVVDELAGRAGEADGAALEHIGPGGDFQAGPGVLLD